MLGEQEENCVNHELGAIKKKWVISLVIRRREQSFDFYKVNLKPNHYVQIFQGFGNAVNGQYFTYQSACNILVILQ